jgi:regulator of protease activity HflC (stomatin/prohibitin superfamily)
VLAYSKNSPTTYVLHYQNGKVRREGPGLAFWYYRPPSTIVAIPLASRDVPFAFSEVTADFQPVTLQGQLTYRVSDPRRLAGLLDFSIKSSGQYTSDDPDKLPDRLIQTAQILARAVVQRLTLREALVSTETLVAEVVAALRQAEPVRLLGVEILALSVLNIKPTPEIARALEADARETMQRQADEAVYARRNASVEQERRIKESELQTEIAVQEKQRQIRETQIGADIAIEERRAALVERRSENDRLDADARAYALKATLEPVRGIDWRTLMAIGGASDPKLMIAMAFRELAENAAKIGEINVTPDLLASLTRPSNPPNPPNPPSQSNQSKHAR